MYSGLCIYDLAVWLNLNFLYNSQWITFLTQKCLALYSSCVNLLYLIMWMIVLSLSPQYIHFIASYIFLIWHSWSVLWQSFSFFNFFYFHSAVGWNAKFRKTTILFLFFVVFVFLFLFFTFPSIFFFFLGLGQMFWPEFGDPFVSRILRKFYTSNFLRCILVCTYNILLYDQNQFVCSFFFFTIPSRSPFPPCHA